jgi:DnaD/phage-associated family protein
MSIIRVRKDAKYFSASNEPFNDVRLSWESRGLMGYLLSKPNNWQVRQKDLEKQGPAGSRKVKRMLAELRLYGYMNRIRTKMEDGKFDWTTEVFESPSQNPRPSKGIIKTSGTKCTSANSTSAKPLDIDITDSPSTESHEDDGLAQISKAYEAEIGVITAMIADELQDASITYPLKWVLDAIHEAAVQNKRGWKYCLAILKRWKAQGNQDPVKLAGKKTPSTPPADDDFEQQLAARRARLKAEVGV